MYIDDGAGGSLSKTGGSTLDGRPDIRSLTISGFSSSDSGKEYRVRVRALNRYGYAESEIRSVTMGGAPTTITSISIDSAE